MSKQTWRGGNMLYPVPSVLVSCGNYQPDENGHSTEEISFLTIAWTGTVCSDPPMAYISVRPERHSYELIRKNMDFVINLTTESLVRSADFAGVRSGRDIDKFQECHLTPERASSVNAPLILESPVNLECRVKQILPLGSHDMFLAEIVSVHVDESLLDSKGTLHLERAHLISYSHGSYFALGRQLGTFGFSVRRRAGKS